MSLPVNKTFEELVHENEIIRRQIWSNAATACANTETVKGSAMCIKWANEILLAFDSQFPNLATIDYAPFSVVRT